MHKGVEAGMIITYHQILNTNKEKLFFKMKVTEFNSRITNKKYITRDTLKVDLKESLNLMIDDSNYARQITKRKKNAKIEQTLKK